MVYTVNINIKINCELLLLLLFSIVINYLLKHDDMMIITKDNSINSPLERVVQGSPQHLVNQQIPKQTKNNNKKISSTRIMYCVWGGGV